jgi:hypothetical protein
MTLGANSAAAGDGAITLLFHVDLNPRAVPEQHCSVTSPK